MIWVDRWIGAIMRTWSSTHYRTRAWKILVPLGFAFLVSRGWSPDPNSFIVQSSKVFGVLLMLLGFGFAIYDFRFHLVYNSAFDPEPEELRQPLPSTKACAESHCDDDCLPYGGVIEIIRFEKSSLGTSFGVKPSDVTIRNGVSFDFGKIPKEITQAPIPDKDNQKKFSLVSVDRPLSGRPNTLVFYVNETNWSQWIPYKRYLENNADARHKYGSPEPKYNVFPNSFCLHGIVAFRDGVLLVSHRHNDLEFEKDAVSISFEEQLSAFDLKGGTNDAEDWMRRALCEEVFPLKTLYNENPRAAWDYVAPYVQDKRIWSLLYEETIAGYAAVGFYQLNIESSEYETVFRNIKRSCEGSRDPEGSLLLLYPDEMRNIIDYGAGKLKKLNGAEVNITREKLHSSSLYRLIRYTRAREKKERKSGKLFFDRNIRKTVK